MNYTYKKSEGEEIWTVGYDDNGKWIPESDWESESDADWRVDILNRQEPEHYAITCIRKRIEEMHKGYRSGAKEGVPDDDYWRGAADACANILDLPELRLFLPAKGEQDAID